MIEITELKYKDNFKKVNLFTWPDGETKYT